MQNCQIMEMRSLSIFRGGGGGALMVGPRIENFCCLILRLFCILIIQTRLVTTKSRGKKETIPRKPIAVCGMGTIVPGAAKTPVALVEVQLKETDCQPYVGSSSTKQGGICSFSGFPASNVHKISIINNIQWLYLCKNNFHVRDYKPLQMSAISNLLVSNSSYKCASYKVKWVFTKNLKNSFLNLRINCKYKSILPPPPPPPCYAHQWKLMFPICYLVVTMYQLG